MLVDIEYTNRKNNRLKRLIRNAELEQPDASMDRISYDSYKIDIESIDPSKDLSMREVYGLDPAKAR